MCSLDDDISACSNWYSLAMITSVDQRLSGAMFSACSTKSAILELHSRAVRVQQEKAITGTNLIASRGHYPCLPFGPGEAELERDEDAEAARSGGRREGEV